MQAPSGRHPKNFDRACDNPAGIGPGIRQKRSRDREYPTLTSLSPDRASLYSTVIATLVSLREPTTDNGARRIGEAYADRERGS